MPAEMKETIARAALQLLTEKHVKKLTVKDIVDQCHITRQAFYYHFENIPTLFCWMMEKNTERTLQNVLAKGSGEKGLRYFLSWPSTPSPMSSAGWQAITGRNWNSCSGNIPGVFSPWWRKAKTFMQTVPVWRVKSSCAITAKRSWAFSKSGQRRTQSSWIKLSTPYFC